MTHITSTSYILYIYNFKQDISDLWIASSFPCLFSTAGWGQVGAVDVSPLDASNASNRALTIAARFQIGSGAGDFKVPLETRRCRDYQAVEWSKSRSCGIWQIRCACRACAEIIRGRLKSGSCIYSGGGFIEPWLAVDSSFAWRIPSPHAGVRVSPLFEEVRECFTKCQDSAAFGHLVRPTGVLCYINATTQGLVWQAIRLHMTSSETWNDDGAAYRASTLLTPSALDVSSHESFQILICNWSLNYNLRRQHDAIEYLNFMVAAFWSASWVPRWAIDSDAAEGEDEKGIHFSTIQLSLTDGNFDANSSVTLEELLFTGMMLRFINVDWPAWPILRLLHQPNLR